MTRQHDVALVVSSSAIALLCLIASVPDALAQEAVYQELRDQRGYWTEERLESATPLDLPLSGTPLGEVLEQNLGEFQPSDEAISLEGSDVAPEDEVPPDLEARLYPEPLENDRELEREDADGVIEPQDFGTSGAPYSSSQLIPTNARLSYPYRTVGILFFTTPQGDFICSGAVLRHRLVLTAGHCVHSGNGSSSGFFSDFLFVPAFEGGQAPFQAWQARAVQVTRSWFRSGGSVPNRADFAILIMRDRIVGRRLKKIGQVVGFLGARTNSLAFNHTKKVGFPGNFDNAQIMHQVDSADLGVDFAEGSRLYGSDMGGGSSGGPWVQDFGKPSVGQGDSGNYFRNRVVGVASFGFVDPALKVQGSSTLNDEFIAIFQLACRRGPGNCTP